MGRVATAAAAAAQAGENVAVNHSNPLYQISILFSIQPILITIRRLALFPFRSLHPFCFPFFDHTNSCTRQRYIFDHDEIIYIRPASFL